MPSIHTATAHLPANVRDFILWQWEATQLVDDGGGYLDRYLQAINSQWIAFMTRHNELSQTMRGIHALSEPPMRRAVVVETTLCIGGMKAIDDAGS